MIAGGAPAFGSRFALAEKAVRESIVKTALGPSSVADIMIDCILIGLT